MKYLKKLILIFIPIIIGVIFTIALDYILDKEINNLINNKDIASIKNTYGSEVKDKGIAFNEYVNEDIVVQGSSELGVDINQVITKTFPIKGFEHEITTYGRAYYQYLSQTSILVSFDENKEKDVVIINSLQWFLDKPGISQSNFQSTFSPVQFYSYFNNEKISKDNKIRYAKRMENLLHGSNQYSSERAYAKLFIKDDCLGNCIEIIFKPYFMARKYLVELKDKGLLYRKLKTLSEKEVVEKKTINWENEYAKAEEEGEKLAKNNEFAVLDTYYDNHLRANVDSLKGKQVNVDLLDSKEYEDYELYLDTCLDLGINPYIILMPTNGLWYDYIGISEEKRQAFYSKIESMAEEKGFDVLNLQDEEYNAHFMIDIMHLGWKGWLRVDEEIYNKYK